MIGLATAPLLHLKHDLPFSLDYIFFLDIYYFCKSCRYRQELSNEYLLAKIGFDTAENGPLEVCQKLSNSARSQKLEQPQAEAKAAATPAAQAETAAKTQEAQAAASASQAQKTGQAGQATSSSLLLSRLS